MRSPALRPTTALLAAALVVGACNSAVPSTAPPSSAASTGAPSIQPSPTAPASITELFAAQAEPLKRGAFDFSGRGTIGDTELTFTGSTTYSDGDSKTTTRVDVGGASATVDVVQVKSYRYTSTEGGPFLRDPEKATEDLSSWLAKIASGTFTDTGTEMVDGQPLHRLEPAETAPLDPAAVLGEAEGVSDASADIAFMTTDRGEPVTATLSVAWKQTVGKESVAGAISLDLRFFGVGQPTTIETPDAFWNIFRPEDERYTVAFPSGFRHSKLDGYDYYQTNGFASAWVSHRSAKHFSALAWAKAQYASLKKWLHTKKLDNEQVRIDGHEARLTTISGMNSDEGRNVTFYQAIVVRDNVVYFIEWEVYAGNEDNDRTRFDQMLTTFHFT